MASKINCYIYHFSVPNILGSSEVFLSSLDVINAEKSNGSEVLNYILDSAIKDVNKKHKRVVNREDILIHFVSLINVIEEEN